MPTVFLCHTCADHDTFLLAFRAMLESMRYEVNFDGFPGDGSYINAVADERMEDADVILLCGSQAFLNAIDRPSSPNLNHELDMIKNHHLNKLLCVMWEDNILSSFPEYIRGRMGVVLLHQSLGDLSRVAVRMEIENVQGKEIV
jgi:hypothetical protein